MLLLGVVAMTPGVETASPWLEFGGGGVVRAGEGGVTEALLGTATRGGGGVLAPEASPSGLGAVLFVGGGAVELTPKERGETQQGDDLLMP